MKYTTRQRVFSFVFTSIVFLLGIAFAADSDNDGMSDLYENFFTLNPTNSADATQNLDTDSLINSSEAIIWTDPRVGDTDTDGFLDGADSNALSRAVMMWGKPEFTTDDAYTYTGPNWWIGAGKVGGVWTNGIAWLVQTNEQAILYMDLDRTLLTNNLMISLFDLNAPHSLVTIDLLDTNNVIVATNVANDITSDDAQETTKYIPIPLQSYPSASRIVLRAITEDSIYRVFKTTLYVDNDGDGLDADQEAQVGSDDRDVDSDKDGLNDYAEVMVYKTDPTKMDTDGDGLSDGKEVTVLQTSPTTPIWLEGGLAGSLQVDRWNNLSGSTKITGLIYTPHFGKKPDAHYFVDVAEQPLDKTHRFGVRIRGTITAPEAGVYKFRLSAKKAAQAWLSDSANPYDRKLLIDQPVPVGYHSLTPSQVVNRTVEKTLTSNQVCYVEILLKTAGNGGHASLWWQRPGSTLWEVIPSSYLQSYVQPSDDKDQDGLPDAWEAANGLEPNNGRGGGYLDHDGDLSNDLLEYQLGTSPRTVDSDGDGLRGVNEVLITKTDPKKADSDEDGIPDRVVESSLRGIYTAYRRTGHVSAKWSEQGENLRHSSLKYFIVNSYVEYDMDISTAGMKQLTLLLGWNHKPSLSSRPLVRFYIDGNEMPTVKVDIRGAATIFTPWLTEGKHRIRCRFIAPGKTIPSFWIHSISLAAIDGADADGDGIQDWMAERMGEQLDSDGDGLSDHDEIMIYHSNPLKIDSDDDGLSDIDEVNLWKTDPAVADSDGDGVSDGDEVLQALTNPLVADFGTRTVLSTANGSSQKVIRGSWRLEGSSIYATSLNGELEYTLTAPNTGSYVLEIDLGDHNNFVAENAFEIEAFLDGTFLGKETLVVARNTKRTLRFWLPDVATGNHAIRLKWNNIKPSKVLQIHALRLVAFAGPDTDGNGKADWIDARSARLAVTANVPPVSFVSPLCVEGESRYPELVSLLADFVPVGATQELYFVKKSLSGEWYTNITLSPKDSTLLSLDGGMGGAFAYYSTRWVPLNLLTTESTNLTIRLHDALLLEALPEVVIDEEDPFAPVQEPTGCVQFIIDGPDGLVTNVAPVTTPVPFIFDTAGDYTVTTTYSTNAQAFVAGSGSTNMYGFVNGSADPTIFTNAIQGSTLTVKVVDAHFASDPSFCKKERTWTCPDMPADCWFEADANLAFSAKANAGGGTQFKITLTDKKPQNIVARIEEEGPIVDVATVSSISAYAGNYWSTVATFPDGSEMGMMTITLSNVPPDIKIKLSSLMAGVTFDDGSRVKILTAADFNAEGVATYYLIKSASKASICHKVRIMQGDEYL